MNLDRRYVIACFAVVAATFAGCGQDHGSGTITAEQGVATTPSASASGAGANGSSTACRSLAVCSDGQALAIAIVANQGEIDEANAVVNRVSNADVRVFAQQMILDHTRLRDALVAVAANPSASPFGSASGGSSGTSGGSGSNGGGGSNAPGGGSNGASGTDTMMMSPIVQQPNAISRRLQQESQKAIAELMSLEGQQLDRAYLEREVLDHLLTLGLMEHVVIPSVTNPALAMALGSGTPIVKMHEMAALQVQTRLEGACGGMATEMPDAGAGSDSGGSGSGSGSDGGSTSNGGSSNP